MDDRRAAGPKTHGRNVGGMIEASGNNFRHADEWLVGTPSDRRHMKSIEILSDILQEPPPPNGSIRVSRETSARMCSTFSAVGISCGSSHRYSPMRTIWRLKLWPGQVEAIAVGP